MSPLVHDVRTAFFDAAFRLRRRVGCNGTPCKPGRRAAADGYPAARGLRARERAGAAGRRIARAAHLRRRHGARPRAVGGVPGVAPALCRVRACSRWWCTSRPRRRRRHPRRSRLAQRARSGISASGPRIRRPRAPSPAAERHSSASTWQDSSPRRRRRCAVTTRGSIGRSAPGRPLGTAAGSCNTNAGRGRASALP